MKKVIVICLALALMASMAACSSVEQWDIGKYLGSIDVLADNYTAGDGTQVSGNIMAVFYTRAEQKVLFWCNDAQIIDNGDGTWDVISSQAIVSDINQALVQYGLYQYQPFTINTETPPYLADLGLQPITWADLPQSMHVAALKSVTAVSGSPRATVVRKYLGINYEVPGCRVSQVAYDNYVAGKIKVFNPAYGIDAPENKDCFVLVYFITEVPYTTELNIPVVIDKVIK